MGDEFATFVKENIKARNDHIAEKQDLIIELDPVIAAAFGNSLNISSRYSDYSALWWRLSLYFIWSTATKGRSVHLMKAGSKRKRSQAAMMDQYDTENFFEKIARESDSKIK